MPNFAHIENNTVANILVAENLTIAEEVTKSTCIEVPKGVRVEIGYTYDGTNFSAPLPLA